MNFWLAVYTLWNRELVRFYRQPSRVVGAVGTAFLFWLVLGSGIGGGTFRVYFFPGTVIMSVMFTCIFSNASVIEDRQAGFLQSVLVAPVGRSAVVMGKIIGGATLSTVQGLILVPFALTIGGSFNLTALLGLTVSLFLFSFALNALGFWLAWKIESMPGYHTVMNLVYLPLWMASGAIFKAPASNFWLNFFMAVNPFTYGVAGVRRSLFPAGDLEGVPSLSVSFLALLVTGLLFYAFSSWVVSRSDERR